MMIFRLIGREKVGKSCGALVQARALLEIRRQGKEQDFPCLVGMTSANKTFVTGKNVTVVINIIIQNELQLPAVWRTESR